MQQKRNGKQLMMIGGILIVLVLGVGFFFTHQGGGSKQAAASSTQPVVVASQTIAQGTVFQRGQSVTDLFKVQQEPSDLVPFGAYTSLDQITALTHTSGCGPVQSDGCQGQVTATQTIFQGTPVVSGMFSTLGQYRTGVDPAFAIPYGYVATSIPLTLANSVQGSVSPGDDVDLIATYTDTSIKDPLRQTSTQYALNDLRVVSVNGPPSTGSSSSSSSNPISGASSNTGANATPGSGGNLVVLVRFQQALIVQHLKDDPHWTMSVVLRSAKETDIQHFKTLTVNGAWYFAKQQNPFQNNPGY